MYKKVLVPLDGSELAECVLPHVESIVKGCTVQDVTFLRVVEPASMPIGTVSDGGYVFTESDAAEVRTKVDANSKKEAEQYLKQVVNKSKYGNVSIKSEVITGKTAETIADYATQNEVDLIIIASHGRSGISRWVLGSVAERIAHITCAPVLIVRTPGCVAGF